MLQIAANEVQEARQIAAAANQQMEAVQSAAQQATQLAQAETAVVHGEAISQLTMDRQVVDERSRETAEAKQQLEDANQCLGELYQWGTALDQLNTLAKDTERYIALDIEHLRAAYHDLLTKANAYAERTTAELQGLSQRRLEDQRAAEQKLLLMADEKKSLETRMDLRYRELQDQFGMFKTLAEESELQMRRTCTQIQAELKIANERI